MCWRCFWLTRLFGALYARGLRMRDDSQSTLGVADVRAPVPRTAESDSMTRTRRVALGFAAVLAMISGCVCQQGAIQGGAPATGGCDAGFADCNGNQADGCEASVLNDVHNCGSCGVTCTSGECATATCEAGTCGQKVNSGASCLSSSCTPPQSAVCDSAGACKCVTGGADIQVQAVIHQWTYYPHEPGSDSDTGWFLGYPPSSSPPAVECVYRNDSPTASGSFRVQAKYHSLGQSKSGSVQVKGANGDDDFRSVTSLAPATQGAWDPAGTAATVNGWVSKIIGLGNVADKMCFKCQLVQNGCSGGDCTNTDPNPNNDCAFAVVDCSHSPCKTLDGGTAHDPVTGAPMPAPCHCPAGFE